MKPQWRDYNPGEDMEVGYYALHYSWDSSEGSFINTDCLVVGAKYKHRWGGCGFRYPLFEIAGPFETESEADDFAEENDNSW